jgi:hypothetical protein
LKLTLKLQEGLNSRSKIEIRNDVMWDWTCFDFSFNGNFLKVD